MQAYVPPTAHRRDLRGSVGMVIKHGVSNMNSSLKFLTSACVGLLLAVNAWAAPYSGLYVFGDSLSDAGNNPSAVLSLYILLGGNCDPGHPCPPYVDGHYSNGPTAAERLADAILPGGASPGNFFSFATSGSTTGIGNFGDGGTAGSTGSHGLPGMAQQLGDYSLASSGMADPNALYFVWGGANDFLTLDSPIDAAQNIANYVAALATMGASTILVPNLPDLALTPFAQIAGVEAEADAFSTQFNATLALLLTALDATLPAEIIPFDTFAFFNDVVSNPAAFGFTDASGGCLLSQPMCSNPDDFVFWDDFHPTTAAHAQLAAAFARAVPEPGSLLLVVIGIVLLGGRKGALRARRLQSGRRFQPIATSAS